MNNINLVSGKSLDLEKRQAKTLKIVKISAIISLFIVALISISLFIITLLLPTSTVKKNQTQALQGISGLHKKLVTYALSQERLKNIESVLVQRKDYPQVSNEILNKLPGDMSVDVMNLENDVLTLTVTSPYLISINQYIDDFVELSNNSKNIKHLSVQSLQFNVGPSTYTLTFQANIL